MKHKAEGQPHSQQAPPENIGEGERPAADESERAWKIAQLAATLAARYPVPPGQPQDGVSERGDSTLARNEADPQLDRFYISLLRRAEFLLNFAGARFGQLHAADLFDPRYRYTVKEITKRFEQAGWAGLTSENSVRSLLKDVQGELQRQMNDEINRLSKWCRVHATSSARSTGNGPPEAIDQSDFLGVRALRLPSAASNRRHRRSGPRATSGSAPVWSDG